MSITRRGFLAGGLGLLAGTFGAKLLPHAELAPLVPRLPAGTFLYRPSAASAGSVFGSWSELMAAVKTHSGPRTVVIDASIAPARVEAGTWDLWDTRFVSQPEGEES